jgi:hypothetical protein
LKKLGSRKLMGIEKNLANKSFKKKRKKAIPPLSLITIISRFKGNCDTIGEGGEKNSIVVNDIGLVCLEINKYIYILKLLFFNFLRNKR